MAVAFGVFTPSNAMAQDVEVMVIPLSDYADGDAAPDGSGFVLLASSAQPSRYGVVITSDSGVSSAEITVGQDGSFATTSQEGNSGYDLDAPVALNCNGGVAYAFAVKARGPQAARTPGAASSSWLDNYANWFNGTFGSGYSYVAGGAVYYVTTPIVGNNTLANASDGALLIGTAGAAVGVVVVGEYLLGVGTIGALTSATTTATTVTVVTLGAEQALVGSTAVVATGLGAGTYPALVVNGTVYVARFHNVAWQLAGYGTETFYGLATIDALGRVISLTR